MSSEIMLSGQVRVFLNHIYELKKGVRNMVLMTLNAKYKDYAIKRLEDQNISYFYQSLSNGRINLFFGKKICLDVARKFAHKPFDCYTPEEDFILGTLLGYDVCVECERYCELSEKKKIVEKEIVTI